MARRTHFASNHKQLFDSLSAIAGSYADLIDLRLGWSQEHQLPEHILAACKGAIEGSSDSRWSILPDLKHAIARKLEQENSIEVDPLTQILVTTGASEAIWLAILTLVDPGDEVIMADPGYLAGFESNIEMLGGKVIHVTAREERDFKVDPQDIQMNVSSKTKMVVIVTPENPTGAVCDKRDLESIADIAKEHNLMVVSDEIFEKLVYDDKQDFSIGALSGMEDRTLTINGFTKGYNMPGYRIGYIVGPESLIRIMGELQFHMTDVPNQIGQAAALAAIDGPQGWIKDAVKEYGRRRDFLVAELNKIERVKCSKPEGGFTAFPNMKELGLRSIELVQHILKQAHVRILGGPLFGHGANSEGYVQIGFCRPMKSLKESVTRIRNALESL